MAPRVSMDFFESQAAAKRKTTLLILYFLLAVAFIICGVYGAVLLAWNLGGEDVLSLWSPPLFSWVALGVVTVVLIGSLYKIIVLSKGGDKVAETLGATPVIPNTTDPDERKLVNVVEEMAIASGVPVPRVYVLQQEKNINAFAAGLSQGDAVVAVTRGGISRLSRDELQGVVAHEFSHILNGDMRLNLRLIGVINGILVIAIIGRVILRGMSSSGSRSSDRKGGGSMPILVLAFMFLVVGYIGVFFGKLIKSAVSRQREFLADASAVQFTRNPSGLLGALKQIAGLKDGSLIRNARAEEASHLFFGNGLRRSFLRMLSTHPPIEERIRRIEPSFKGLPGSPGPVGGDAEALAAAGFFSGERSGIPPERLVATVGKPQPEHLAYAENLLADLPPLVTEAAREPFGARALIYSLLLNREKGDRKAQMVTLKEQADPAVMRQVLMLMPLMDQVGGGYRLPVVDMAMPALRTLSAGQYTRFRDNVKRLVEADRRINLFEYTLQRVVFRHLDRVFHKTSAPRIKYRAFDQIRMECTELLSLLAWQGTKDGAAAEEAFRKGWEILEPGGARRGMLPREKCSLKALNVAIQRLSEASFPIRRQLLQACELCISADARITLEEAELLRAVADTLDCPIPPLFPGVLAEKQSTSPGAI
ncbi:MAG: M48 family metallopeptidase [Deltaproteobacteria bacterium]|nr:M48 family metallopeptidase [Deltaproteobacteria bacterium]